MIPVRCEFCWRVRVTPDAEWSRFPANPLPGEVSGCCATCAERVTQRAEQKHKQMVRKLSRFKSKGSTSKEETFKGFMPGDE